jgi:hypothetical protein
VQRLYRRIPEKRSRLGTFTAGTQGFYGQRIRLYRVYFSDFGADVTVVRSAGAVLVYGNNRCKTR